jgi:predicted GNAT superfamily acetyltransferase
MRDGLNIGLASDRFDVDWYVNSPRVIERVEKGKHPPKFSDYTGRGVVVLNPATMGEGGLSSPSDQIANLKSSMALVEIPSDFLKIKEVDFELAGAWRVLTREIFEDAFDEGYLVSDFLFVKDGGEARSYYLLTHHEALEGLR